MMGKSYSLPLQNERENVINLDDSMNEQKILPHTTYIVILDIAGYSMIDAVVTTVFQ